jgi:NADH-quinone oxidoreductase subunit J
MLEQVSFIVVSVALLLSAAQVVTTRNLVHTVLWLGITLALTAVLFLFLRAPFMAAIQIILYTGGVLTLMLFGVMLTHRDKSFVGVENPSHRIVPGAVLAFSVFLMLVAAVMRTPVLPNAAPVDVTVKGLGESFFTVHALAFEVLSVLLLGAVLGAIVMARKRDAGDAREDGPAIAERRSAPVGGKA